jgi:ribosomal protein S12 methylthiotransferase
MKDRSFYLESLGCAKNSVDSSSMASILSQQGFSQVPKPSQAKYLIVNTCGFIKTAREESIESLQTLGKKKQPDQKLIAAGCMTELHREELQQKIPQIDGFLSTLNWMQILRVLDEIGDPDQVFANPQESTIEEKQLEKDIPRVAVQGASAYLKIADGCRRGCAFCSIPLIKGPNQSRSPDQIVKDAKILSIEGVKEIILIAQDTTDYGSDLGLKDGLANLLLQLTKSVPEIPWIRVMYAFPGAVSDKLIEIMASHPQVLHYFDIPLQHANVDILRNMKRPFDLDWIRKTIGKMRTAMPDLAVRSTFIVGYPGETEKAFEELLHFLEEMQFDHVGAFTYSREEGTPAYPLGDPIPEKEKESRLLRLMEKQAGISLAKNQKWIGKRLQILVEGYDSGISIGRSYRDAPEIDGLVITEGMAKMGEMANVRITGALTHDLTAVLEK